MRAEAQAHSTRSGRRSRCCAGSSTGTARCAARRAQRAGRGPDAVGRSQGGAGGDARAPPARRGDRRDPRDRAGAGRHGRADRDGRGRGRRGDGRRRRRGARRARRARRARQGRRPCSPARPTPTTPISRSMPAPAAPRARTGPRCCSACTRAGPSATAYKVELVDYHAGEQAGIKSATLLIKGENAYGYAKTESGVHRLVRISPYDSSRAAPHQLLERLGLSGDRRRYRHRGQRERPQDRHLPRVAAPAASTSTPPTARCGSPICRPGSSSPARTSARSTRTAPRR